MPTVRKLASVRQYGTRNRASYTPALNQWGVDVRTNSDMVLQSLS